VASSVESESSTVLFFAAWPRLVDDEESWRLKVGVDLGGFAF
jgi:hypothetical protein